MDYYSTLGVDKNTSQQDLKKAYKKKSMQFHPDRPGGDEAKFKEVNEAYSVLSDPTKRRAYDEKLAFKSGSFNFDQGGRPWENINPFFNEFFRDPRASQSVRQNRDIRLTYKLMLDECFTGKDVQLRYTLPSGDVKDIDIKIPPGAKNGDTIRFEGLGDNSIKHMPKGNLLLTIKLVNRSQWRVDGYDLHGVIKIPVLDFMLGTDYVIDIPPDKTIQLNIPKGTQTGTTFSVHGHGIPNIKNGKKGTVYIKVNGIVPKIEDEELLKQIDNIRNQIQ